MRSSLDFTIKRAWKWGRSRVILNSKRMPEIIPTQSETSQQEMNYRLDQMKLMTTKMQALEHDLEKTLQQSQLFDEVINRNAEELSAHEMRRLQAQMLGLKIHDIPVTKPNSKFAESIRTYNQLNGLLREQDTTIKNPENGDHEKDILLQLEALKENLLQEKIRSTALFEGKRKISYQLAQMEQERSVLMTTIKTLDESNQSQHKRIADLKEKNRQLESEFSETREILDQKNHKAGRLEAAVQTLAERLRNYQTVEMRLNQVSEKLQKITEKYSRLKKDHQLLTAKYEESISHDQSNCSIEETRRFFALRLIEISEERDECQKKYLQIQNNIAALVHAKE